MGCSPSSYEGSNDKQHTDELQHSGVQIADENLSKEQISNNNDESIKILKRESRVETIHIEKSISLKEVKCEHIVPSGDLKMEDQNNLRPRSISIMTDDGLYENVQEEDEILEKDAEKLNRSLQVFNSFERDMIDVIVKRNNSNLQKLRSYYSQVYHEDLLVALQKNTSGNLKLILTNVLLSPEELISKLLQKYIENRNFVGITEVLTGGNPKENKMGRNLYKTAKGETLEASLTKFLSNTSDEKLDKILIPLSRLVRHSINKDLAEDVNEIQDDVERLSQGSENVIDLLCCQPYSNAQLAVLFEQFKLKYYQDIRETIDIDFHDTAQQCLKTIVDIAECTSTYYTRKLRKAIYEENLESVVDIITSRYQLDMASIRDQYEQQTGLKLKDSLKSVVKGDALYALLIMVKKETKK